MFIPSRPCAAKENGRYLEESEKKSTFKYKWRQCWEVYHAVSGIISIALGFTQVSVLVGMNTYIHNDKVVSITIISIVITTLL